MSEVMLTENDQRILAMAWHCFTELPKVDYAKLAEMGGYKTPASATTAYLNVRKKVLAGVPPPAAGATVKSTASAPSTSKAAGKKRAATETPGEGSAKRGRKSKAEMQTIAVAQANADDDEAEDVKETTETVNIKEATTKDEDDADDDAKDGIAEVKPEQIEEA
ncbi:uncharacterized protein RCC_09041 [Ramularia collo-cygni]|uniref:Histone h1.3 n=1 Tax=Ramularia collo-cygni TaxID=112498 RepID=A0A2D3VJ67_9PEZI|nr:uncharacterized protein RCC_09041 [Ramularia collo-cygni]CZT23329.1 uncharacterized protein RCC_09041 [Ramularia collo-cygni]